MTQEDVEVLSIAILAQATRLSVPTIRQVAAAVGIDASRIPSSSEDQGGHGSRAEVVPALFKLFSELPLERKSRALPIMTSWILRDRRYVEELTELLRQHGYQSYEGSLIKIGVLDPREAQHLPPTAQTELAKAITRLADNDESGAVTAACAAVDATTTALYVKHNLGSPEASFQSKVNTAINRLGVIEKLQQELEELGIKPSDATEIAQQVKEATKHATEALQVLRRTVGDVHGTKPTYTRIVYETIKWSSAVCALLNGE